MIPGVGDVVILGSKALREQLNIDIMEIIRAKALGPDDLTEFDHGLAGVPRAGSTVAVGLRRVTVPLGAMQRIAGAEEGSDAARASFVEKLLSWGPGIVTESELEG